jgi:hypothetical protein
VDDLRVADELQRHEPGRAPEVVLAHGVDVALDRRDHEVVDRPDVGERPGDLLRAREVDAEAARSLAELGGDALRALGVAPGHDDLAAALGVAAGDLPPDSGRSPDDDDGTLTRHGNLLESQSRTG